jgi:hypothetical protein
VGSGLPPGPTPLPDAAATSAASEWEYLGVFCPWPPPVSKLDRTNVWLLSKAHNPAFLSWFGNGLLASGIGVIFMQSDMDLCHRQLLDLCHSACGLGQWAWPLCKDP